MRYLLIICAVLCLAGCTAEQVRKSQEIADRAALEVERAREVVIQAEKLAETLGVEKAKPIADQARQALEAAQLTAKAAQDAANAAKAAQEAGGSSVSTIFAAVMAFLTGAGAALPAIMKAANTGRALIQTVRGIENAKGSMSDAEIAVLKSELAKAQDEKSKELVAKAKG